MKARRIVGLALGSLGGAKLVRAAARLARRPGRGLVLMYHRVSSEPDYLGLCVSPENFDCQLALLTRSARVIPLSELVARVSAPEPLTEDIAAITFDDGYRDNLDVALPILKRHELPATVFVTTDFLDGRRRPNGERLRDAAGYLWQRGVPPSAWPGIGERRVDRLVRRILGRPGSFSTLAKLAFALHDIIGERVDATVDTLERLAGHCATVSDRMLDWDGVRRLAAQGVEIGSHTVSHPILSRISPADAERELIESKRRIEQETRQEVRGFAFPNGRVEDFTHRDVLCLQRAGYAYACTTERGVNIHGSDPLRLLRLGVGDYVGGLFDLRLALGR